MPKKLKSAPPPIPQNNFGSTSSATLKFVFICSLHSGPYEKKRKANLLLEYPPLLLGLTGDCGGVDCTDRLGDEEPDGFPL